ncbi:hypothetical protein [Streptomyces decoyicus]
MTVSASPDGIWSIGERAGQADVTVKTVRFYSERGLLPGVSRPRPLIDRYRQVAVELPTDSQQPTIGAMDDWLRAALDAQVA